MPRYRDITDRRFGSLVAIKDVGRSSSNKPLWLFRCDCGNEKTIIGADVISGRTRSCGCAYTQHGHAGEQRTPEYQAWQNMKQRCRNLENKYYGGRGITCCQRWANFQHFIDDMGQKPDPSYWLERHDNSRGYSPCNCYWAPVDVQLANRRQYGTC